MKKDFLTAKFLPVSQLELIVIVETSCFFRFRIFLLFLFRLFRSKQVISVNSSKIPLSQDIKSLHSKKSLA